MAKLSTKKTYLDKMSQNATNGDLWGDFIVISWISQYLQRPIYLWCKMIDQIMMKCGE